MLSLQKLVFHVTWCILHTLADASRLIQNFYQKFKHVLNTSEVIKLFLHRNNHNSCVRLQKIPQHVTVLFNEEYPNHVHLANLILWSITCGISYISFYDHLGRLQNNHEKVQSDVEQYLSALKFKHHVIWHRDKSYSNGYREPKVHVKLLHPCDSRAALVQTCQELSRKSSLDFISIEDIDRNQRCIYEFPDPCLGIYFGEYFNLCGYPPWQIRLTEFLQLATYEDITYHSFIGVMSRFSNCQQRLGK